MNDRDLNYLEILGCHSTVEIRKVGKRQPFIDLSSKLTVDFAVGKDMRHGYIEREKDFLLVLFDPPFDPTSTEKITLRVIAPVRKLESAIKWIERQD